MNQMSESIAKLASALVKAQKNMGNASKDSKNPFFKSKYADLNAVREAVLPPLNEQGISVIQPTVYIEGKKFVQTMFVHESGEYISGLTEVLSAKETDAQAQGSGISYARRYGLQSMANVGAEDDDGEGAVGRKPAGNGALQGTQASSNLASTQATGATPPSNTGTTAPQSTSPSNTPARRSFKQPQGGSEENL